MIQLALHASVSLNVSFRQEHTSFSRTSHVLPPWMSQTHIALWLTSSSNSWILIKRRMKFLDILHYFNFQGVSYVKDSHFKVNSYWSIHTYSHKCASFTFLLATNIPENVVSSDTAQGYREKQAGMIIRAGLKLSAVTITNIPGIRKVTLLFPPFFPPLVTRLWGYYFVPDLSTYTLNLS